MIRLYFLYGSEMFHHTLLLQRWTEWLSLRYTSGYASILC
jgi:hypothetical protein